MDETFSVAVHGLNGKLKEIVRRKPKRTENGPVIRYEGWDYPATESRLPGAHYAIQLGTELAPRQADPIESMKADCIKVAAQCQLLALTGSIHALKLQAVHQHMKEAVALLSDCK